MPSAVSIIVPVYNDSGCLRQFLNSLCSQSLRDIEIILVNDGSDDRSGHICRDYASGDFRIKFVNKTSGGACSAMNCGLEQAAGEYVTFLDAGECPALGMAETAYKAAKEKDADCVLFGGQDIDSLGFAVSGGLADSGLLLEYFCRSDGLAQASGKFFRTDIVGGIRFADGMRYGGDYIFNIEALSRCSRVLVVPDILYRRTRPENARKPYIAGSWETLDRIDSEKRRIVAPLGNNQLLEAADRYMIEKCIESVRQQAFAGSESSLKKKYLQIKRSVKRARNITGFRKYGKEFRSPLYTAFRFLPVPAIWLYASAAYKMDAFKKRSKSADK